MRSRNSKAWPNILTRQTLNYSNGQEYQNMRNVADKHQIRIAKQTLRLSDAGVLVMGGMTKAEARGILRAKAGWTPQRIRTYENR